MGAAGMPITSVERLTFLDFEIPLVSSSSAPHDAKRPEKSEWDAHMPQAGSRAVYEFALPAPPDEQLLPALAPREFDMSGFGGSSTESSDDSQSRFISQPLCLWSGPSNSSACEKVSCGRMTRMFIPSSNSLSSNANTELTGRHI